MIAPVVDSFDRVADGELRARAGWPQISVVDSTFTVAQNDSAAAFSQSTTPTPEPIKRRIGVSCRVGIDHRSGVRLPVGPASPRVAPPACPRGGGSRSRAQDSKVRRGLLRRLDHPVGGSCWWSRLSIAGRGAAHGDPPAAALSVGAFG